MKNRILAIIMICAIALAIYAPAFAGEPAKVRFYTEKGSGTYYINQETGSRQKVELENVITANVEITDAYDADLCSGIIYMRYDAEAVNCLGYNSVTGGAWQVNDKESGKLRMAFSNTESLDDGIVFTAAFEFKEGVSEASFSIEIGELLTGDVINGDVPADYYVSQETDTYEDNGYLLGDANLDEKVNTLDAVFILKHSAGILTLEGQAFIQGDVNVNGKVNTADATLILKYAAGLIDSF